MAGVTIARALYAFAGEEASDLSFREDEIIRILKQDESGWWIGQTDDGRRGEFPYNYVEIISAAEEQRVRGASRFVGNQGYVPQGPADQLLSVQVTPKHGQPKFTVEVRMSRKMVGDVKQMEDFRKLDEMLKYMYPNFDRPLPPVWADRVFESEAASRKKAKVLEIYLAKMLINTGSGNELTEYALVNWLSPRESFNCNREIKDQVSAAFNGAARQNGGRNAHNQAQLSRTVLARADYPWDQKDAVELPLQVGSLIAVRNQNTYNEGWWEGEDTAGQRGLFPNNYVTLLKPNEASKVIQGGNTQQRAPQVQPQQFGGFNINQPAMQQQPTGGNRQRKTENNFAIPNLDAFDELLNDGFTMLENDQILIRRANAQVPREGDTVTVSYVAFVWDCQNQKLIEFASSDLPDQQKNVGPLVFQVGSGNQIKGLDRAVQNLETGQNCRVIITPDLGYGEVGNPPNNVPPNCHLVYDLTLDAFQSNGGGAAAAAPTYTNTGFVQNRPKRQQQPKVQQEASYNFQEGTAKKYSLNKLREIVRMKTFAQHEVDPKFVEDHLSDNDFMAAFNTSRTDFMLMQRWKRSKLKQDAGLY